MTKEIYLTAKFAAKEDCVADMISLLERLASQTKSEKGFWITAITSPQTIQQYSLRLRHGKAPKPRPRIGIPSISRMHWLNFRN